MEFKGILVSHTHPHSTIIHNSGGTRYNESELSDSFHVHRKHQLIGTVTKKKVSLPGKQNSAVGFYLMNSIQLSTSICRGERCRKLIR